MSSSLILPHSQRHWVPQGHTPLAPACTCNALAFLLSLQCVHLCIIMEVTVHIHLQGNQEHPPHGASGSMCRSVQQMGIYHLNAFSRLCGDQSTISQSSTRAHTKRTMATGYHMLYGGHWLPPSSGVLDSSTFCVFCRLSPLYH